MKKPFLLIIIIILLASCAPIAEYTQIVTESPSTTTTPIITKSSKTPTLTLLAPTRTILPSPSPTWNICEGAEEPENKNNLSSDGNWLAIICQPHDDNKFTGVKIIRLDGTVIWTISFYEIYGKHVKDTFPPDGIRDGEMQIAHWSKDGNFVYLNPYFCCVDEPGNIFFNYFHNSRAIYRLDLGTGKLTTTLQPILKSITSGFSVSFSPTDKYIGYVASSNSTNINIYNIQTGDIFNIQVENQYAASGIYSWSHDSSKLLFIAVKPDWVPWDDQVENGVSYFVLDLDTKSVLHLLDDKEVRKITWTIEGNLIIHEASEENGVLYDFQKNTFTAITSTPNP